MTEINDRNDRLDGMLKNVHLNHWQFDSGPNNRSNELNNEPVTVLEMLSEAGLLYILGSFDACTVLSSIAVEKLLRFILSINNKFKLENTPSGFNPLKDVVKVNTVKGPDYFFYKSNRLMHFAEYDPNNAAKCKLEEVLSLKDMPEKVKPLGYDVSDIEENIPGSANVSLFISTRDTTVHGNFIALGLNHENYKIRKGQEITQSDIIDLFVRHKDIALKQYKRACNFTQKAFQKFDSIYPSS
ncbi:MAG: hypothetical protein QXU18_08110 [Thermoplasmatales archaeon]